MIFWRLAIPVVAVLLQLVAALLAIGAPDLRQAEAFFFEYATVAGSLAAAKLLVWAVIAIGGLVTVVLAVREIGQTPSPTQRRFWEGSVLVVGILILLAGAARDLTYQVPMQGGSVPDAHQALEALHPSGH